jgi:capsule polysaccharide export protein KpsE/RkpR
MNPSPASFDLSFLRDRAAQKRIAAVVLAFAVAGVLYGVLAPKWYRSTLTAVPAQAQKSAGIAGLLGGDLVTLAAGLGATVGGTTDVARIAAVLQSTAVTDAVIAKFDLQRRYDVSYLENAREKLWDRCQVKTLPKPGLVQLSCEDKDPGVAQQLVAYFAEIGNEAFRRVSSGSASEEVRFLERRVADLRREADESSVRLREFQEKHGVVDLDTQARAVMSSVATLRGQRIAKQMELDYARTFSGPGEPGTRQLESQLSVMDEQLRELEVPPAAPAGKKGGTGLFPAALAMPRLRAEGEKLYRDRKVAEATLVFALDRLEGAKAAQARDVSTFVVLDPATLPTKKSRPRVLDSVVVAALLGLVAGLGIEWWKRR